ESLFITMPSYSAVYDAYFSLPSRFLIEACHEGRLIDFKVASGMAGGLQSLSGYGQVDRVSNDEPRYVPELHEGDKVRHEQFGDGTVLYVEDEEAIINFVDKGTKKLNITFAPMEKI
ncbi:MAG TPA: hypothetical protein VFX86_04385, partial [Candidatus Saccharimonadales bacterium]|nr:hypothetical protein [Candidatus Saccharimonadales bacterium]